MKVAEVDPNTLDSAWVLMACRNHPDLRWVQKNPAKMAGMISRNPQLMFRGEMVVPLDGPMYLKEGHPFVIDRFHFLKCRLEGVNPFDTSLRDEIQITSWDEVAEFVKDMEELSERYSFECTCPASELYVIGPSE